MTDNKTMAQLSNELDDAKRAYQNAMKAKWIMEIKNSKMDFLEEIFEIKYQWQRYIERGESCESAYEDANDTILDMIKNNIPRIDGVND